MKFTRIILFLMILLLVFSLVACGSTSSSGETNNNSSSSEDQPSNNDPSGNQPSENQPSDSEPSENQPSDSEPSEENPVDITVELAAYKTAAFSKLDEIVNPIIAKVSNEDLRNAIQTFYDTEKVYINGITELEESKLGVSKIIEDSKSFAKTVLKPLAIEKLDAIIVPLIEKISHNELKDSVRNYYDVELAKINAVDSLEDITDVFKEILDDTKQFIESETEKVIMALKDKAINELDPYIVALIDKIPFETLKEDTQTYYETEKKKLEAIQSIEDVTPCINEIKNDLELFVLTEAKKIAVSKLDEVVNAGIEKIPNPVLKQDLLDFSKTEVSKLNAITTIDSVKTTLETVMIETETHIKNLLVNTVKDYLAKLTAIETATAYDYIPQAMQPSYSSNVVRISDIDYDFSINTSVSNISKAGYGEQWQMIVENIEQSISVAKVFNVIQTVLNAAGNAVDIYITNSYSDEMSYKFSGSNYTASFEYKDSSLIFGITMTEGINVPGLGTVRPVVKMEYDLANETKGMFISVGDSYKVKYVISEKTYEMATTYGLTLFEKNASRSTFLSINIDEEKTTGHIYEYTTYEGSDKIKACADFYIVDNYVSVVGNKSSGMTGFDGYINELYLADEGRLLGYEVRESLTVLGVTGTYNTLWFNLWDIQGVNTIRVTDKTSDNKSGKSTVNVYLNELTTLFSPTYNTKLGTKTSRKYDIELRSRFYYTYDAENDKYISNEILIPMMFVQEGDNFSSFAEDMKKDNNIVASVSLQSSYLNKILDDYDVLIDVFIQNKEKMSSDAIMQYLGQYD